MSLGPLADKIRVAGILPKRLKGHDAAFLGTSEQGYYRQTAFNILSYTCPDYGDNSLHYTSGADV